MEFKENIIKDGFVERLENEPVFEVPIIDIIRHGKTEYKELADHDFKFHPDDPNFALDASHLDLTEEGMRDIQETAERLASLIDNKNEVVLLVSSPQMRAMSSVLIIEKIFKQHGIIMFNSSDAKKDGKSKGIKTSPLGLGQIPLIDKEFGKTWLESHKAFGVGHPDAKDKPPVEVHEQVALSLGKELSDIFSKSHADIATEFKRFLRHAINIEKYLQDETKQQLNGKRLRIVAVTHEERIMEFAKDALGLDKTIEKGQLLEVNPQGGLRMNGETEAKVKLFGKNNNPDLSADIKIKFDQGGLSTKTIEY